MRYLLLFSVFLVDSFEARKMFKINNNMRFSTKIRLLQCSECRSLPACVRALNVYTLLRCCLLSKTNSQNVRTKTLLKQQRIWNIQNRRDLRFTEREKVAHHRTDYQVTSRSTLARLVCTGFERAKSGHLIVCPLIFFFIKRVDVLCGLFFIARERDDVAMMMFLMSLFVLFSFLFCIFLDGVFIN